MSRFYDGSDVEEFIFGESADTYEEACKKEEGEIEEPEKVEESTEETVEEEVVEVEESEIEVTSEELNMFGVIECVDDPEVACYRIALENEMNYNAIMNAFMAKEFSVLESTGQEMVYEAVDVAKYFNAISTTIKRWWNKIQGVFRRVIDKIAEYTDANLAFVKKYKGQDFKAPEMKEKFMGFDFDKAKAPKYLNIAGEVALAVDYKKVAITKEEDAEAFMKDFKERYEGTLNKMRGLACGKGEVKAEDFDKELKVAMFGSEEKVELSLKPFPQLIKELEGAKLVRAMAKCSYKEAESSVKSLMKQVKGAESQLKKMDRANAGMKIGKCLTDSINACLGIMSKTMSMDTKAMIMKVKQDRAMAGFYVANHKEEKKAAKHEAAFEDLGIVLI